MIIPTLIRTLLGENSVTITGLGTFFVKKLPTHIKDDIIFPPQNIIEFEYSKEVEGFDFVSKLSKWEQIRIDEAQSQILEWLDLLETGLNHNKSIFFDDFGTFSKNEAEQIIFQSVMNFQLNIENEGFEPVLAPSNKNILTEPTKDKRIVLVKKAKKRDKRWFLLTIFVAASVLCVLFIKNLLPDFYQTVFSKKDKAVAMNYTATEAVADLNSTEEKEVSEIVTVNNSENNNHSNALEDPAENQNLITMPESNDIYTSFQEGKYYVIAGSFLKEDDALRHIKQKKLEQYNAKLVIHPQNKRLRVCIGIFDNEKDAEQFAVQVDKNYWVLK